MFCVHNGDMAAKTAVVNTESTPIKRRGRKPRSVNIIANATPGTVTGRSRNTGPDIEGLAILSTCEALSPLEPDARIRVMAYVGQRYGIEGSGQATETLRSFTAGAH